MSKENSTLKIGEIVLAPLGVSEKKTKVKINEIKDKFAKVEYVEKKVREELGNRPFLISTNKLSPIVSPKKIITNRNRIQPQEWVGQIMKQFPNWINTVFLPYRVEEKLTKKDKDFTTYQKFVRDYLSSSSPYRGLLIYHGLGSGKTCTSIAVAENLKENKNVVVLSPATLRNNYLTALKSDPVCGTPAYKNNENLIDEKYTFISYNASNTIEQLDRISSLDNHTIVIDEVHNLISMMVTKSKKGPEIYKRLMEAKNVKIVALSGTPIINYPFEVALLANILRGYLEVPTFFVKDIKGAGGAEWQTNLLKEKLAGREEIEYVDVYQRYVYLYLKINSYDPGFDGLIKEVMDVAVRNGVKLDYLETKKYSLFPEEEEEFRSYFIEETNDGDILKNMDMLKRRLLGLISYYRGGKSGFYPTVNPVHFEEVPMSKYQYQVYAQVREIEREKEKAGAMQKMLGKAKSSKSGDAEKKVSSLFRVFSRQFSNFVFPEDIERPFVRKFIKTAMKKILEKKARRSNSAADELAEIEKEVKNLEEEKLDPKDKSLIDKAIKELREKKDQYLKNNDRGLQIYSPKMSRMLEIMDQSPGLILVYSTFRSLEGIGIFSLVLEANGWAKYDVSNPDRNADKKKFAVYSGAEDEETRERLRQVFNSPENKYGEKLKALLVTSAGAEGIDLKNIRQVHIMEPYWHDVRVSQVIGRANRFMSHIELPEKDRVVDVYRYMTVFTPDMKSIDKEKETTDQYIYGVALKKLKVTDEIKKTMKEIAVDCTLNAVDNEREIKCFTFGLDASGLAYKANIREDLVYGKTEIGTKLVKKKLEPMFLDGEGNLIWADAKKKQLCYFNNRECKEPLKKAPKSTRKVGVDMDSFEVYDVEGVGVGNLIKLGVVDENGKLV